MGSRLARQDPSIRQFLLTNLHRASSDEPWTFRVPVDTIKRHLAQIGDFPYDVGSRTWDGRTLFVKGAKSKYLNRKNIPVANVSERGRAGAALLTLYSRTLRYARRTSHTLNTSPSMRVTGCKQRSRASSQMYWCASFKARTWRRRNR